MPRVARNPTRFIVSSQIAAAEFFGVSRTTVAGWIRLGAPGRCSNNSIDLKKMAAWVVAFKHPPTAAPASTPTVDDPDMSGPPTPALEQFRAARAALAELDLAERRGQLVVADDIHQSLLDGAVAIRKAGDMLRRQFGNQAGDILDEALATAEAASEKYFESLAAKKE